MLIFGSHGDEAYRANACGTVDWVVWILITDLKVSDMTVADLDVSCSATARDLV